MLTIGKKTLNRYYDKTDHSEVFRIAIGMDFLTVSILFPYILLVLHSWHKLYYFKNTEWKDEWIKTILFSPPHSPVGLHRTPLDWGM